MPAAQFDWTAAVLDIGGIVFGKELDLRRSALEAVMLLESGKQDLADKAGHLALLRRLHRQDDADRLGCRRVIHIEGARPPGRRDFRTVDLIISGARGAAEAQ